MALFGGSGRRLKAIQQPASPLMVLAPPSGEQDMFEGGGAAALFPNREPQLRPYDIHAPYIDGTRLRPARFLPDLAQLRSDHPDDYPAAPFADAAYDPEIVDGAAAGDDGRSSDETDEIVVSARRQRLTPAQWRAFEARQAAAIAAEERESAIPLRAARGERIDATPQRAWVGDGGSESLVEPTGDYVPKDNPALAGVRDIYRKMLAANRPHHEVRRFLKGRGIVNADTLTSVRRQLAFRRHHPEVPISAYSTDQLDDMWVEVDPYRVEARKQKEAMERFQGKPGAEEVITQGVVMGFRDEGGGFGNVIKNGLMSPFTDEEFDPYRAYQVGKQIELMRLEEARGNVGWAAVPLEVAGALLAANPTGVTKLPSALERVKAARNQGAIEGMVSGFGNGEGFVDSSLSAISGGVLGGSTATLSALAPELPGMAAALIRRRRALRRGVHPAGSVAAKREAHGDQSYRGMGNHFYSRAQIKEWLKNAPPWLHGPIKWFRDSPFNVLKRDTYREMYVDHYLNDPRFWGARMPKGMGGGWRGKDLGIKKHDDLQATILGAPPALKMVVGVPLLGANAAAGSYLFGRDGESNDE
ncbi:hypothetical protein [Sphingosinicella sp. BN140058]|uniref:hypothetical protein n=1 Tax=Sphingosinicella sp. BN140058 TaxID=1892855 RepID=UPI0010113E22|nr:hypothetical protein [Sphingosinicella sp. BN140058]QAY75698.1 hypothetical protein ETR14_03505 [Sphingosinicella sp. BN140058]